MNIEFRRLETLDEMLPNLKLIQLLSPSVTMHKYQINLSNMIPHRYAQVVAICENEIVGVSGYWILTKLYSGPYLEVDNFVVDPAYRKIGIGEKLIQFMEKEAKKHNCYVMMLDAYLENTNAHSFYRKHGFEAKGYHFIKQI